MLLVIAECAQGYAQKTKEDSILLAKWLVRSAKASNANAVKFQLVIADELACYDYKYYSLFKSLELGFDGWRSVALIAKEIGIDLIFDIYGEESLLMAENLDVTTIKIHPTDFTNKQLLQKVASSSKISHVLAGSGGSYFQEIEDLLSILVPLKDVTLIHGFQGYPTVTEDNFLTRISLLKSLCELTCSSVKLGYADHANPLSIESTHLAATAIGFGVTLIEKHLTLARCLKLEDHEAALSPDEFTEFVETCRACFCGLGAMPSGKTDFNLPVSEQNYRQMVMRHVVSARPLSMHSVITSADICLKRSSIDNPLTSFSGVIGKVVLRDIDVNQPITSQDLKDG